jgi:hypothetical protein
VLSPHGQPRRGVLDRVRREVPFWVIGVATVATLFFVYLGFGVVLDWQAGSARDALRADREMLHDRPAPWAPRTTPPPAAAFEAVPADPRAQEKRL